MKQIILSLTIMALFSSCLPEQKVSSSTSSSGGTDPTVTSTTGDDGGNTTGSTTGDDGSNGTNGTTGNSGGGFPIHSFNLFLAGMQDWFPQSNTAPLADTFITPQEAGIAFQTDGTLRVRLKVKSQSIPPTNQTGCYGRNTGVGFTPYYQSLKFDLFLRDVICPGGGTNCSPNQYILGSRYRAQYGVGPVAIDSYSQIIDVGNFANQGVVATTVEISNVRSDQYCASNGSFCPAEKNVRTQDCWNMELEVQTSYTQSF
jgi:hypothetical protein